MAVVETFPGSVAVPPPPPLALAPPLVAAPAPLLPGPWPGPTESSPLPPGPATVAVQPAIAARAASDKPPITVRSDRAVRDEYRLRLRQDCCCIWESIRADRQAVGILMSFRHENGGL